MWSSELIVPFDFLVFYLFSKKIKNGPILQSSCSAGRYTAGQWSLTRPGVFFIGRDNGNIDIWDLLKKTHEPSHFQNISKSTITFISPSSASGMWMVIEHYSATLFAKQVHKSYYKWSYVSTCFHKCTYKNEYIVLSVLPWHESRWKYFIF